MEIFLKLWVMYIAGIGLLMCMMSTLGAAFHHAMSSKKGESYKQYAYVFIIGFILTVISYWYLVDNCEVI